MNAIGSARAIESGINSGHSYREIRSKNTLGFVSVFSKLEKNCQMFLVMHCEVNHQFIDIKGGIKFIKDHKIFRLIRAIFAQLPFMYPCYNV